MSLPDGVSIDTDGRQLFVTQRGYFAEHFSSCMFAALCSILTWMGYRLPLARKRDNTPPENFVHLLHVTSGAPLDKGTKIKHTRRAMRELLPDAEVQYGRLTDDEFLEELRNGAAIRVTATLSDLPARLQKLAGSSSKGHAFCVIGTRMCHGDAGPHSDHNGVREIFWMDPMGRPSTGYRGDWISWGSVRPHLRRRGGEIVVTLGYKDAATTKGGSLPADGNRMEPAGNGGRAGGTDGQSAATGEQTPAGAREAVGALFDLLGFRGRVGARTPVLNPQTREVVTHIAATNRARCLGPTADRQHFGILVNTSQLPGRNPKVLLVEASRVERVQP